MNKARDILDNYEREQEARLERERHDWRAQHAHVQAKPKIEVNSPSDGHYFRLDDTSAT